MVNERAGIGDHDGVLPVLRDHIQTFYIQDLEPRAASLPTKSDDPITTKPTVEMMA